jgi:hypothetical protein
LPPPWPTYQLEIVIGAQRALLKPRPGSPLCRFEAAGNFFAAFPSAEVANNVVFHVFSRGGEARTVRLSVDSLAAAVGFSLAGSYGYQLTIPIDFDVLVSTLANVEKSVQEAVGQAPDHARAFLVNVLTQQLERTRREYAARLEARRDGLKRRRPIFLAGRPLGYEAVNEHEVLILAGKMETAIAKELSEFLILEHTAQIDIDGILRIRRQPGLVTDESATVEFEFSLGNFFAHRHPIPITRYIICWTVGGFKDGTYRFGPRGLDPQGLLSVELASLGWMKVLKFSEDMIYVLPLEQFPALTFAQPASP